ncbi:outer membrane beta-barrel protein [bacterium SCSIO 12741]|nr:outer membrane beta-barrel protein [bacterium SCSIO 12741]
MRISQFLFVVILLSGMQAFAQKGQWSLGLDLSSTFANGLSSETEDTENGTTYHSSLLGGVYLSDRLFIQFGGRYKYTEFLKQNTSGKRVLQQTDLEVPLLLTYYIVDPEVSFRPYFQTGLGWTVHTNEKWILNSLTTDSLISEKFASDNGFGPEDFDWTLYFGFGAAHTFEEMHEVRMLIFGSYEFDRAFRAGLAFEYNFLFPRRRKK